MERKYNVFGMGNALVDLELLVNDHFLHSNKIEKGVMTLVDEPTQNRLMEAIQGSELTMQCGGSAANTIIAVSQLGGKSFYSCKVANDGLGRFYASDLVSNGVDTNLKEGALPEGITGKCLVMVTEDAERTMNTFLGITSDLSMNEIDLQALENSEYLYIEGYLVTSPIARDAMKKARDHARANGVKVALTFSDPSMVKYFRDGLQEVVGDGLDLIFCNEHEACLYTGKEDLEEAKVEMSKIAKQWVITMGSEGAVVFDGKTQHRITAHLVEAVDTNGAGDMFAGAFLYGITNGLAFAEAGNLASLASSRVVSQFGPRLNELEIARIKNLF